MSLNNSILKSNIEEITERSVKHLIEEYREISDACGWHQYLGSGKIGNIANAQALLIFQYFDEQFDNKNKVIETLKNTQLQDPIDKRVDGGWTYRTNYSAAPTTECTCWTLYSFVKELDRDDEVIVKGIDWLLNNHPDSNKDLGWGSIKNDQPRVYATCLALRVLIRYRKQNAEEFKRALSWLRFAKNKDGGWGDTDNHESTITHTAHVIITLILSGVDKESEIIQNASDWLLSEYEEHENWIDIQNGGLLELLDFENKRISYYHYSLPWVLVALLKCGKINTNAFFEAFNELITNEKGGNWIHPFLVNQKHYTIWSKHDSLLAIYNLKKNCSNWDSLKSIKLKGEDVIFDCGNESFFKRATNNILNFVNSDGANKLETSERGVLKWWIVAIICGVFAVLLKVIINNQPDWIDEILIFLAVSIIVLLFNPKRRYYKAFWTSMTLLSSVALLPAFNLSLSQEDFDEGIERSLFKLIIEEPSPVIYVVLGLIAAICLFLDYRERKS